ncbi:MAG: hypothetical protein CL910_08875 [Deltaproteobacteria bacterium]|nr:hypothetical protein [Deltaproteobacteria bacterium]
MDRNFLMAMALSLAVVVTWTMYTEGKRQQELIDNPPPALEETIDGQPSAVTEPEAAGRAAQPSTARAPSRPRAGTAPTPIEVPVEIPQVPEVRTRLETALWDAEFTSHGARLLRWDLRTYDDPSQAGRPQVEITTLQSGEAALATPFTGLGFGDLSTVPYELEEPDPLTRIFTFQQAGVTVRKSYFFEEDSYAGRLRIEIENGSDRHLQPRFALQWPATARDSADFRDFSVDVFTEADVEMQPIRTSRSFLGFGGGGIESPVSFPNGIDWAAASTTYFLAAIAPEVPERAEARVEPTGEGAALLEVRLEDVPLPPGQRFDYEYRLYLGPKEQTRLDAFGNHLDEAIMKGWFPSLTRFFGWALDAVHDVFPNYGVAIIIITVLVRLLMAPLMGRQMKSMKRMSDIAPKMKEIQEKFSDDRDRQSQEMMALYKREGVSPFSMLSGCLPMLLQFPVFIGFYFALQSAIQLRQQPFAGWIDDLSQPEALFVLPGLELPVRVLPILMGASMFLQQKLTPSGSMDPAQQRMMMTIMPIMFTVLFYQFASGLVLYWFCSTLIGIGQQLYTNRNTPAPEKKAEAT